MTDLFSGLAPLLSGSLLQDTALWALRSIPGFPPIIQTVHILGIAVVMGSVVLLNLRLLGLAVPALRIGEIMDRSLPWLWIALLTNLLSGSFFVFARPERYFNNPVFVWKMLFLLAAIALSLYLYWRHRRELGYWEQPSRKWQARFLALASLTLWLMVPLAGRWIAYLEYIQYPLWSLEPFDAGPQPNILLAIENWPLSQLIASTNWFPLLESLHVIAAAFVVGSILWVDLRLLGLAATPYPISTLSTQLVPWAWGAFVLATVTGLGMFITRAASHLFNPAFQWKLVLLLLAGANMAYFHFRVYKSVHEWDEVIATPTQLKVIGASSLILWCGVMLAGRWVGHIV